MSTIAALATPPGSGAIHVIRLSGSNAFEIINRVASDEVIRGGDRIQVTYLRSRNNRFIDRVVLAKFYAPKSYTGEDCIEISCHGNNVISKLIMDELIKHGAVHARPGEFTRRAFLNGKLDLNQVISIGNLFGATSELEVYSSVDEIRGATSQVIGSFLSRLLDLISICEVNIDYPPDIGDNPVDGEIRLKVRDLHGELSLFLERSQAQRLSSPRIVLVGRPNAGKSSLFNYLIGQDRVIVSPRAGTTRDSVEADYVYKDYLLTLVDTAGISKAEDFNKYLSSDRTRLEMGRADLIIYLISVEEDYPEDHAFIRSWAGDKPLIIVYTKGDLGAVDIKNPAISVLNGDVSELLKSLELYLVKNYSLVGLKSRAGINHLCNACSELEQILNSEMTVDLMAEHLVSAHEHMGQILNVGKNSPSDRINHIFDNFCIGK